MIKDPKEARDVMFNRPPTRAEVVSSIQFSRAILSFGHCERLNDGKYYGSSHLHHLPWRFTSNLHFAYTREVECRTLSRPCELY